MSKNRTLLVIIPDHLSTLINKGEITERYYNPGEMFDEVHILMINNDRPDKTKVQKSVGNAKLYLHNLPADKKLFLFTLGWRPLLLRNWAKPAISLTEEIKPALIRCHGNLLNTFVAYQIKQALGIPYVVSLHTNPEENLRYWTNGSLMSKIQGKAIQAVERVTLVNADLVLPVYQSIVSYLKHLGVEHFEVCYNVLNPTNIQKKDEYTLHDPVRLISVGRQIPGKNPDNIIRAASSIDNLQVTFVGSGAYHENLRRLADEYNLNHRINFVSSMANDALCCSLREYDLFALHCDYGGIPKTVLEAFLAGMPVVVNQRNGEPVPELTSDICMLVSNTPEAYCAAIKKLIEDHQLREELGRNAFSRAQEYWSPSKTEDKYASLYRRVMGSTF